MNICNDGVSVGSHLGETSFKPPMFQVSIFLFRDQKFALRLLEFPIFT